MLSVSLPTAADWLYEAGVLVLQAQGAGPLARAREYLPVVPHPRLVAQGGAYTHTRAAGRPRIERALTEGVRLAGDVCSVAVLRVDLRYP